MKFSRFFLPHPETHEKSPLLSFKAFVVYFLLFFLVEFFIRSVPFTQAAGPGPMGSLTRGVLGITSLSVTDLISLTNQERAKSGLPALQEDSRLNAAAQAKAKNMFEENYWAHYSPSGKDPWGFIQGAGYKFSYAGENLARNFETSPEVVAAWMASPTHRDNIVNTHYTQIGMAVAEGTINGQKTILVVQEFGRPSQTMLSAFSEDQSLAQADIPQQIAPQPSLQPEVLVAGSEARTPVLTLGPVSISKTVGLTIVGLLVILIGLDIYILRRRMVHRISSRHLPHLALLAVAGSTLWNSGGEVTRAAAMLVLGN